MSRQPSQPNTGNPAAAAHFAKAQAKRVVDAAAREAAEAANKATATTTSAVVTSANPTLVSRISTLLLDKRFLLGATVAVSAVVYYRQFGLALPWQTKKAATEAQDKKPLAKAPSFDDAGTPIEEVAKENKAPTPAAPARGWFSFMPSPSDLLPAFLSRKTAENTSTAPAPAPR